MNEVDTSREAVEHLAGMLPDWHREHTAGDGLDDALVAAASRDIRV